jgi:hypothetical protein
MNWSTEKAMKKDIEGSSEDALNCEFALLLPLSLLDIDASYPHGFVFTEAPCCRHSTSHLLLPGCPRGSKVVHSSQIEEPCEFVAAAPSSKQQIINQANVPSSLVLPVYRNVEENDKKDYYLNIQHRHLTVDVFLPGVTDNSQIKVCVFAR